MRPELREVRETPRPDRKRERRRRERAEKAPVPCGAEIGRGTWQEMHALQAIFYPTYTVIRACDGGAKLCYSE